MGAGPSAPEALRRLVGELDQEDPEAERAAEEAADEAMLERMG